MVVYGLPRVVGGFSCGGKVGATNGGDFGSVAFLERIESKGNRERKRKKNKREK